jgi:hypothetical protein
VCKGGGELPHSLLCLLLDSLLLLQWLIFGQSMRRRLGSPYIKLS